MKFQVPLGFRAVTDRRPVDGEALLQNASDCARKFLEAGFDAAVEAGPRAPSADPVSDAQCAGIREGVRFDVDVEAFRGGLHDDPRVASPQRRCASELRKRPAECFEELRSDIEQGRQGEIAVVELAMRHVKTRRRVWPALVPKQVEIDASGTPPLVRIATAAETTFGSQQHRQKLDWRTLGFQTERGVEIPRLWRSEGFGFVHRGDGGHFDTVSRVQQGPRRTDRGLPRSEIRPDPNDNRTHRTHFQ